MKPQDQRVMHDPENGQQGDCMRAVIASLLELDIEAVPHFAQMASGSLKFYGLIDCFLESQGYEMNWGRNPIYVLKEGLDIYHLISGVSPRDPNVYHCVVGLNGQVHFDPHPSRAGLAGDPKEWCHCFLTTILRDEE